MSLKAQYLHKGIESDIPNPLTKRQCGDFVSKVRTDTWTRANTHNPNGDGSLILEYPLNSDYAQRAKLKFFGYKKITRGDSD